MLEEFSRTPTLLIVDDTPQNLDVARDLLEKEGYQILIATSGEKALKRAEAANPDLILLDIQMPGMDGFQTCEKLKTDKHTKDIPIIFLTAQAETDSVVKGFELGAVDYVTKPFNARELIVRVHTHLTKNLLQKQLQVANASKDKFFSIIGHDLKNPFNAIIGLLEIIKEDFDELSGEEVKQLVLDIHSSATKAYKLLENLLHWSRSQLGVLQVVKEEFNVLDMTQKVIAILQQQAANKNISLDFIIDEDLSAYADVSMIDTVMRNLISNAIKYTGENGNISVTAIKSESNIVFSVIDTGVGIDEEIKEKLFSITENISTPGTDDEDGTGLGLILCNEFVRKNGGRIKVSDNPAGGTIFSFSIPVNS